MLLSMRCTNYKVFFLCFVRVLLQGRDLAYPEVVPFRLTQNMIDAMGPTGYEGTFRKCCQVMYRFHRSYAILYIEILMYVCRVIDLRFTRPVDFKHWS